MKKNTENTPASPEKKRPQKKSCCLSCWLLILLLVAFIVGSLYCFNLVCHYQKNSSQTMHRLQNKITQLTNQQTTLHKNTNHLKTTLNQLQKTINASKTDWQLIQTKRLIETASITLSLQHNKIASLQLLQAANQQLRHNKSHLGLQQAIQKQINTLTSFKPIDVDTYYLQLQQMNQHIDVISFMPLHPTPSTLPKKTKSTCWRQKIMAKLKQIVLISHHKNKITPLFSMNNKTLFKGYLHLLIAQMQTALLQKNEAIFNAALTQFESALTHYANINPKAIIPFHKMITSLKKINWHQAWPNLDQLMKMAND